MRHPILHRSSFVRTSLNTPVPSFCNVSPPTLPTIIRLTPRTVHPFHIRWPLLSLWLPTFGWHSDSIFQAAIIYTMNHLTSVYLPSSCTIFFSKDHVISLFLDHRALSRSLSDLSVLTRLGINDGKIFGNHFGGLTGRLSTEIAI